MIELLVFLVGLAVQLISLFAFGMGLLPGRCGATNPFQTDRPYAVIGTTTGIVIMLIAVLL